MGLQPCSLELPSYRVQSQRGSGSKARATDNDTKFAALQNEFRNYKLQNGKSTTRQCDSTNSQSTAEPHQRRLPTIITPDYICMVCGEKGSHSFGTCPNAAKNTTIELRNRKWYFHAGNKPVCYGFNYPDGCKRQPCHSDMPAHSATPRPMVHTCTVEDLFPIVTPFHHKTWTLYLTRANTIDEFADIPKGIREGFLMGLENYRLDRTFIPRNHYTLPAHHDFLVEKYAEEIKLGHLSIGYDPALLESWIGKENCLCFKAKLIHFPGHFHTAPLSVAETRPGKLRAIIDQSFPHSATPIDLDTIHSDTLHPIFINPESTSINAIIDSKKFQCAWGTFSECYLKVANAPSGTQAAVFDVESAFRNVPTHPSVRPFTTISLNGFVHLDPCLNFRASPSPGIWGQIADVMVRILLNEGVEALVKWVDDFVFFQFPKTSKEGSIAYSYEADLIWSIADKLGWPWARSKFIPFNTAFPYIGFWWDIEAKFVSLPQAKKEKYLMKLMPWEAGVKMTKGEAESVIGMLNHVCLVVPDG